MRKYFDFAQSLYLQNLIILYIYILCSLVCFPSLYSPSFIDGFLQRVRSNGNSSSSTHTSKKKKEQKTFSPHRFNFLPPLPPSLSPLSYFAVCTLACFSLFCSFTWHLFAMPPAYYDAMTLLNFINCSQWRMDEKCQHRHENDK